MSKSFPDYAATSGCCGAVAAMDCPLQAQVPQPAVVALLEQL